MSVQGNDEEQWLLNMRAFYLSRADDKISELTTAVSDLERNPASQTAFRRLNRMLHNLVGSAGSYGVMEASETARKMLQRLKSERQDGAAVGDDALSELRDGIERLRNVFDKASAGGSAAFA